MPFEITMPQLGLTMESGTLLDWLVEEGDRVNPGQGIFEVETDKASVVVEAHEEGIIKKLLVLAGQSVPVGTTVAVGVAPGEMLPDDWEFGHEVQAERAGMEVEVDMAPRRLLAKGELQASWKARTMARKDGVDLRAVVGSGPYGRIVAEDVGRALTRREHDLAAAPEVSPVSANLAASLGLPLSAVKGSGPNGRIVKADVIEAAAAVIQGRALPQPVPQLGRAPVRKTVPLEGIRGIVTERMGVSSQTTARVTLLREVDATGLIALRQEYRRRAVDVSYNDVLIRVCAVALHEHPQANARMGEMAIEWLEGVNIGLAVDTERGLLVPVLHNVRGMALPEIARVRAHLVKAAREGRCTPDELTGGTFTITNLGMLGVEGFTPVINMPECCILGVGRILRKPVVRGDEDTVTVCPMMTLSLAFDHRVIDGAPAARFLDRIVELVEEPRLLL
jgi:pyruvate dehydrogenase E2 component (dihydrolipoamide acetyltransferase)